MRPPASIVGSDPTSSDGCTMPPSAPTTGRPLSSSGGTDESSPPEPPPPLLLLAPLMLPPLLVLPPVPPELLLPVGPPSLPTVELEEPPHPRATTIDTPRTVRKADMKD